MLLKIKYFRNKIAIVMMAFSAFLSLLFSVLIFIGMLKADDNARESLLTSLSERLVQYHRETGRVWSKDQLDNIEFLIEGRDQISAEMASLPLGYYEEGDNERYVYSSSLDSVADGRRFFISYIGSETEWTEQYEPIIIALLVIVTLLVTSIGTIVGLLLAKHLSNPLHILMERIKSTDPYEPKFTPLKRVDEFGEISEVFADTVIKINEVIEREKQFSQFASHELRTPIAIIQSSLELWQACEQEPYSPVIKQMQHKAIDRIELASIQMDEVIQTFLVLGKQDAKSSTIQLVKLSELLTELTEKYKKIYSAGNVSFVMNIDLEADYEVDDKVARIVLSNALRNAFAYCAGQIEINVGAQGVSIKNDIDAMRIDKADHFGFGMKIIADLSRRIGWKVDHSVTSKQQFIIEFSIMEKK